MPREISDQEARLRGIKTFHHEMDNQECRYRLQSEDGSSYIRTESKEDGWQNAHFHQLAEEFYIVQQGLLLFVEKKQDELVVHELRPQAMFHVKAGVSHTCFCGENTIFHTIKFNSTLTDWLSDPVLDQQVRDSKMVNEMVKELK